MEQRKLTMTAPLKPDDRILFGVLVQASEQRLQDGVPPRFRSQAPYRGRMKSGSDFPAPGGRKPRTLEYFLKNPPQDVDPGARYAFFQEVQTDFGAPDYRFIGFGNFEVLLHTGGMADDLEGDQPSQSPTPASGNSSIRVRLEMTQQMLQEARDEVHRLRGELSENQSRYERLLIENANDKAKVIELETKLEAREMAYEDMERQHTEEIQRKDEQHAQETTNLRDEAAKEVRQQLGDALEQLQNGSGFGAKTREFLSGVSPIIETVAAAAVPKLIEWFDRKFSNGPQQQIPGQGADPNAEVQTNPFGDTDPLLQQGEYSHG